MGDEDDDDEREVPQDGSGAAKKKKGRKKKKKNNQESAEAAAPPAEYEPYLDDWDSAPIEWVDITSVCDLAAQGMSLGEMVESPGFRLVDAMSAIEIMDPKMDSGYKNDEDMTVERAVETGIIATSMSHEDAIVICDQLLMYYLLWLEGHTIVQTCFSCLYLQDLQLVRPLPVFGAFVDAFMEACRQANDAIQRAGIYDDEDYCPNLFRVDLDGFVFSSDRAQIAKRLEEQQKCLAKSSEAGSEALALRLRFMGEYALGLASLAEGRPSRDPAEGARRSQAASKRFTDCLGLVERLKCTAPTPEPGAEALRCFDASINRKLLVPGPPRTVEPIADPQLAFDMWSSHLHELVLCGSITQRPLEELLQGAITHKVEPGALPRSVAHLCASEEGLMRRLMMDSLTHLLFPEEAVQHCKKMTDSFLTHSESLLGHMVKLAHLNKACRFRRLAHVFSEFNALQNEAWHLDEELKKTFGANLRHPRPCWVWTLENCVQAMIDKLLLGFELDLYDQAEFHMIYWYVEYLFGLRIYNLNEVYHAKEQAGGGGSKPKKGGKKEQPKNFQGGLKPRMQPPFLSLLEATRSTVRGIFRLLAFCLRRQLISAPASCTNGMAQRFVLRFRALEHFRLPHQPSFQDFERSAASTEPPLDSRVVLCAAQDSLTEAKEFLEKLMPAGKAGASRAPSEEETQPVIESAKGLRRVVVANQLAITQLTRMLDAGQLGTGSGTKIVAALSHHHYLASVQVVPAGAAKPAGEGAKAQRAEPAAQPSSAANSH